MDLKLPNTHSLILMIHKRWGRGGEVTAHTSLPPKNDKTVPIDPFKKKFPDNFLP